MNQWYYVIPNEKVVGPISGPDLKRAANRGDLKPDGIVWMQGWKEWHEAKEVPNLIGIFIDGRGKGVHEPPPVRWVDRTFAKEINIAATLIDCPQCGRSHFVDCGPCPSAFDAARETAMAEVA